MSYFIPEGTYYKVGEVAKILGIGEIRVRQLIQSGELASISFGTLYLISEDAIFDLRQRRIDKAINRITELEAKVVLS